MKAKYPHTNFCPLIRDIRYRDSLEKVFQEYHPQIVFHAAAYKHVPLMEFNVEEAVQNNILGGKNLIDFARQYRVERFVYISTDKAVNPSSIMGATKRALEIYLQQVARTNGKCIFCAVRHSILATGPVVAVTDPASSPAGKKKGKRNQKA